MLSSSLSNFSLRGISGQKLLYIVVVKDCCMAYLAFAGRIW